VVSVGNAPVPGGGGPAPASPPTTVGVRVIGHGDLSDPAAALAVQVTRADGVNAAGDVEVAVDYSAFRHAFGGDWAGRLRLVPMPVCGLTTPEAEGCQGLAPVKVVNDEKTGMLTATLAADPDPAAFTGAESSAGPGSVAKAGAAAALSAPGGTVFVLAAGSAGSGGSYRATPLSSTGSWDVSTASGGFSYSVPITIPAPPVGSAPSVALTYDSQSVDGRTSGTNTQASWAGMGWDLNAGFIERRYRSCADDGIPTVGDLCWDSPSSSDPNGAYLVLSLGGVSSEMVQDGTGTGDYHLRDDPGWRIQHMTGGFGADDEYWVVSTPDGTLNYFGYGKDLRTLAPTNSVWTVPVVGNDVGEPCHDIFPEPCTQAWRWNLDLVRDPNEVQSAYFYDIETNKYRSVVNVDQARSYTSAGYLSRIEYGFTSQVSGWSLPAKVEFAHVNRCKEKTAEADPLDNTPPACPTIAVSPQSYPDVPVDLVCMETGATACARPDNSLFAPSFFSRDMLWSITTSTRATDASAWDQANIYQMKDAFPATSTDTESLWLDYIQRKGLGTTAGLVLPTISLNGIKLDNVVGEDTALEFYRIAQVIDGGGAQTDVTYDLPDPCTAADPPSEAANHTDCFRQRWVDGSGDASWDWFRKRVVTQISVDPRVGAGDGAPPMVTSYAYYGQPGWRFTDDPMVPNDDESWAEWRGYPQVTVTEGTVPATSTVTRYTNFRGLDGDRSHKDGSPPNLSASVTDSGGFSYADSAWLAGKNLEVETFDKSVGAVVKSSTVTTYWTRDTATYAGRPDARLVRADATYTREPRTASDPDDQSTWRERVVETTFEANDYGFPAQVNDNGQSGLADDQCTTFDYTRNTDLFPGSSVQRWMTQYVQDKTVYDDDCAAVGKAAISRSSSYYDGAATFAANHPVDGNITLARAYTSATENTAATATFDGAGRETSSTTGIDTTHTGSTTTTAYLPATSWPSTGITTTAPLGMVTKTVLSRRFGTPNTVTDPNNNMTTTSVDATGRVVSVTQPGDATPSVKFAYTIPTATTGGVPDLVSGPLRVQSQQLVTGSTYRSSYVYLDGLGRTRETQDPSYNITGRMFTVSTYDDRGLAAATSPLTYNSSAPGTGIVNPGLGTLPSYTTTAYDAQERPTRSTLMALLVEKWHTSTVYDDINEYSVTPPGKATTSYISDIFGRTTQIQRDGPVSTDPADSDRTYTDLGQLATITDLYDAATGTPHTSTYSYDWTGRRTGSVDPDTGTSTTSYDPAGNTVLTVDGAGTRIKTSFDALNRPTTRNQVDAADATTAQLGVWTYDTVTGAKGQLASSTRYDGTDAYVEAVTGYDLRYRVTGRSTTLPTSLGALAGTYPYAYTYNSADQPLSVTYPAAGGLAADTVTTTFDTGHGLPTAMADTNTLVSSAVWTFTGQPKSRVLGAATDPFSLTRALTYDTSTRLPSNATTSVGTTVVQNRDYKYDEVGDPTQTTDNTIVNGSGAKLQECYGYDNLARLTHAFTSYDSTCTSNQTSADGPAGYNTTYTYEPSGNLTGVQQGTSTPAAYTYPTGASHPHAVSTANGNSYSYDANGALSSKTTGATTTDYTWTPQQELATVGPTGGTKTRSIYGPGGTRIVRIDPDGTKTAYLEGTEIKLPPVGAATATRYYTFAGNTVAMRTSSGLSWLTGDKAGSTELAVNATTGTVTQRRYTPYGAPRATSTGTPAVIATGGGTTATLPTSRGFLDHTEDPTGLVSLDHRPYDPALARFINVDPLAAPNAPETLNGYSYANNNPAADIDPSGLIAWTGTGGGGAPMGPVEIIEIPTISIKQIFKDAVVETFSHTLGRPQHIASRGFEREIQPNRQFAEHVGAAITEGKRLDTQQRRDSGTTPNQQLAQNVAAAGTEPVLFGQARIGGDFSTKADVPAYLRGRPLADVSAELRAGTLSPDAIPITAFEREGQLVTVNNRGLAALSDAGFRPTNLTIVDKGSLSADVLARLDEVPSALGSTLPWPSIAVTPSRLDWTVLRTISVPGLG
jgi:RHS repeat-associated protein